MSELRDTILFFFPSVDLEEVSGGATETAIKRYKFNVKYKWREICFSMSLYDGNEGDTHVFTRLKIQDPKVTRVKGDDEDSMTVSSFVQEAATWVKENDKTVKEKQIEAIQYCLRQLRPASDVFNEWFTRITNESH